MTTTATEQIKAGVDAHLKGNLRGAESAYLAALAMDARNATAHNNLGFVYGQEKRWQEAMEHLQTALELNPQYAMAHTNIGQVLVNMGQPEEGMSHLETAVQLDPRNGQGWENLGRVSLLQGQLQKAEYSFWRASQVLDNNGLALVRMATAIAAQHRYEDAIKILVDIVRQQPDMATAWAQLGICYFIERNIGAANKALERALQLNPADPGALRHMALVKIALNEKNAAEQLLASLLQQCPGELESEVDLAVVRLGLGKISEALEYLQDIHERHPEHIKTHYYLVLACKEAGEINRAREQLTALLAASPQVSADNPHRQKAEKLLEQLGIN